MSHKKLMWVLHLLCLLQQPTTNAASTSSQKDELEPFFVRVYVYQHERAYIAVGKGNAHECASFASSQEFIQHVGPVLKQFIDLCGESLGGIVSTDFDTQYPMPPLILTDLAAVESWMWKSRIGDKLHLLRRNYYAPKLLGKAIELVRAHVAIPKKDYELLFEVVCYDGKPVGIIQDDEFVSPENLAQIVGEVLSKVINTRDLAAPNLMPLERPQTQSQRTGAERFLYRHLNTILSSLVFTGEVFAYADSYGARALAKSLGKKTASTVAGKCMGWLWKDYIKPYGCKALELCKKEFSQEKLTIVAKKIPKVSHEQALQGDLLDMLIEGS